MTDREYYTELMRQKKELDGKIAAWKAMHDFGTCVLEPVDYGTNRAKKGYSLRVFNGLRGNTRLYQTMWYGETLAEIRERITQLIAGLQEAARVIDSGELHD